MPKNEKEKNFDAYNSGYVIPYKIKMWHRDNLWGTMVDDKAAQYTTYGLMNRQTLTGLIFSTFLPAPQLIDDSQRETYITAVTNLRKPSALKKANPEANNIILKQMINPLNWPSMLLDIPMALTDSLKSILFWIVEKNDLAQGFVSKASTPARRTKQIINGIFIPFDVLAQIPHLIGLGTSVALHGTASLTMKSINGLREIYKSLPQLIKTLQDKLDNAIKSERRYKIKLLTWIVHPIYTINDATVKQPALGGMTTSSFLSLILVRFLPSSSWFGKTQNTNYEQACKNLVHGVKKGALQVNTVNEIVSQLINPLHWPSMLLSIPSGIVEGLKLTLMRTVDKLQFLITGEHNFQSSSAAHGVKLIINTIFFPLELATQVPHVIGLAITSGLHGVVSVSSKLFNGIKQKFSAPSEEDYHNSDSDMNKKMPPRSKKANDIDVEPGNRSFLISRNVTTKPEKINSESDSKRDSEGVAEEDEHDEGEHRRIQH